MKKLKLSLILIIIISIIGLVSLKAQDIRVLPPADTGDLQSNKINIEPIKIPFFQNSLISFNAKDASVWSWLSFIGSLFVVIMIIFWVGLLIRAGVKAMQSQGAPEGIAEATKQVRSVFIGATLSLTVPIVLSIIGTFLGVGNIFQWPKMFSKCESVGGVNASKAQHEFYFQAYLSNGNDQTKTNIECPQN